MGDAPAKRTGKRPATYQDVLDAPDGMVAELLDGELVVSPRPAMKHANTATTLTIALGGAFNRRGGSPGGLGGWHIVAEPELHLGPHVVVPDLAGWRRERLPAIPDVPYMTLPPDWVCEVVSPSGARRDRVVKLRIYGEFEVPWCWLVDPLQRTVEAYQRDAGRWVVAKFVGGDEPARIPPFDAAEYDLTRWWGDEPEGP